MKKILLFASALAGLFLAGSCQRENLEPEQMAGAVKFTVEAPGAIATKTIADGQNVDVVHYAVYKTNSDETHAIEVPTERPLAQGFVPMDQKKANINFNLLQDQKYTVIFWAQVSQDDNGQNDYYELGDLRAISMKKDAENNIAGNEEARAAFFAWYSFETYEHKDHVVTLKRPFAQLNLLTTLGSLTPSQSGQTTGYTIDIEKSTVTVEGLTSTFYPYAQPVLEGTQGKAEETNETFTFTLEDTPAVQGIGEGDNKDLLKVNGKDYHYVSMNYFFVPVDEYTVNLTYGIKTDKGSIENTVVSVPVKKNFRTNVIGNLLTKESKFEIIVDERFEGDNNLLLWDGKEVKEPAYDDATKTYFITNPAELAWVAQAVNGGDKFSGKTVKLMNDIYLDNSMWTPIGAGNNKFEGTFDGQDNTIFDLNVTTEGADPAGLFGRVQSGYVKNVKVVNARVQGHASAAVVVAHGVCAKIDNCHVDNAVVVSTPYMKDEANNVGGIVGFLGADGGSAWAKDCTVTDADITAYRKVGGIAGAANQAAVVTGNTVKNSSIIADQTPEYKEVKDADLGEIVGYVHTKATVAENTAENVELTHKVNSVEELNNAAEGAFVTLGAGEYNLTKDVTVKEKPVQVKEGAVVINGTDYTITAGSTGDYAVITNGENASLVIDAKVASLGGGLAAGNGAKIEFNGQGVDISKYITSSPARYNIYASRGGEIVINSGTFKFNSTNNTRRAYVCVENGGKVIINGGTFGKASTRADYKKGIRVLDAQSEVIITGGTFGFDPSEWVAMGYIAKKSGDNWVVEIAGEDIYEDENGNTIVYSVDGLNDALAANASKVFLMPGTYAGHFDLTGKTMTIEAADGADPVIEGMVWADNCNVTLKGITLTNPAGVQHPNPTNSQYYASINSQYPLVGAYSNADIKFVDCIMNLTGPTVYGFYGYAHNTPVFEGCTFNCNKIRPIANNGDSITVTGCTFVDQYHYSVRIFENNGDRQTVVYTGNIVKGTNDKGEFEGINISKKGNSATIYADFTINGNTDGLKYRYHKNNIMDASCTYDTDMPGFAFEKEN